MSTAHSFTTRDNVSLTYYLWRKGGAPRPLLVLLHGLGSNHTRWREFVEHTSLADHWDILAPDLRGHSESMVRGRFTVNTWAQDLAEMLAHEGYREAVVVGHSLGAHAALFFAKRYPGAVRGLVLIDPLSQESFTFVMRWVWRLRFISVALIAMIRFLNRLGIRRRHIPLRDLGVLDQDARALIAAGKEAEMVKYYGSIWPDLKHNACANYYQSTLEVLRPLPADVNDDVPVLLLLSAGSSYNKRDTEHTLIKQFTDCTIESVECNHWLLTEKPEEAYRLIEGWLGEEFGGKLFLP